MKVNIRDIAKEAKVSVATVSRLLDPKKRSLVHPKTRAQVEKIIRKHRYVPNRTARALSKHVSDTIGMVTPFSTDVVKSPYFEGLISGIIEGIRPFPHYDLKWIMIRDEEQADMDIERLIQEHSVDGLIFLSWCMLPKLVREIESRSHIPAVLINDYHPSVRSSVVYCENKNSVSKICSYLIKKGHKRLGMIRGPEYISHDVRRRFLSFKSNAKKLGLSLRNDFLFECPRLDEESGYQAMVALIKAGGLPDAIFCANDDLACGAIAALRDHKIAVPRQIAIVGYDDSKRSAMMTPSLTTMRQPLEAMGRSAIEILLQLVSKKVRTPIQLKFEAELIVRQSA